MKYGKKKLLLYLGIFIALVILFSELSGAKDLAVDTHSKIHNKVITGATTEKAQNSNILSLHLKSAMQYGIKIIYTKILY